MLEIGPGRGALTGHLADRGVRLTAVELDDELAAELASRYEEEPRVRVVHGDVLSLDLAGLGGDWARTTVVGNIPYNITTPIIFRLLQLPYPRDIVVTVQAEVAWRILAGPGTRTYGALSVGVGLHARATRIGKVPRSAFRPVPRVDSTVLRITPRSPPWLTREAAARVRVLTRAAFSWRRKQLGDHPGAAPRPALPARSDRRRVGRPCAVAHPATRAAVAGGFSWPSPRPCRERTARHADPRRNGLAAAVR